MKSPPGDQYLPYAALLKELQPLTVEERDCVEAFAATYSVELLVRRDERAEGDEMDDSNVRYFTRNSFQRALLFLRDLRLFRMQLCSSFRP